MLKTHSATATISVVQSCTTGNLRKFLRPVKPIHMKCSFVSNTFGWREIQELVKYIQKTPVLLDTHVATYKRLINLACHSD